MYFIVIIVITIVIHADDPSKAQLGMESLQIGSNQLFTVYTHPHHNTEMGRLTQNSVVFSQGYWDSIVVSPVDGSQWVRIYLGITHEVHGIIMRGISFKDDRYVKTISLSHSMDDVTFTTHTIPETNTKKVRLRQHSIIMAFLKLATS